MDFDLNIQLPVQWEDGTCHSTSQHGVIVDHKENGRMLKGIMVI